MDATTRPPLLGRRSGLTLAVWALLGFAAAITLAVDKYKILADPDYQPSCNFNPVLSCGSVMITPQASAFGFPNPLIGVTAFAVLLTVGLLLATGNPIPRWWHQGLAVGSILGAAFVHWLAFQSLYRIGALCPWCMVVWAVTIPAAVWTTLSALSTLALPTGPAQLVLILWRWRFTIVAAWYLAVLVLVLIRFWDYWSTLV